jgi:predicted GNAT family N-acyltransferase
MDYSKFKIRQYRPDDEFYTLKTKKTIWSVIPDFLNVFNNPKEEKSSVLCEPLLENAAFAYPDELTKENSLCLVLLYEEKIIGMVLYTIDDYNEKQIYLASFCVDPLFRGKDKGVTDFFLKESLKKAAKHYNLKSFAMLASKMGSKLYQRYGFREIPSSRVEKFFQSVISPGFVPMYLHLDDFQFKEDKNVQSIVRSVQRHKPLSLSRSRTRTKSRSRSKSRSRTKSKNRSKSKPLKVQRSKKRS